MLFRKMFLSTRRMQPWQACWKSLLEVQQFCCAKSRKKSYTIRRFSESFQNNPLDTYQALLTSLLTFCQSMSFVYRLLFQIKYSPKVHPDRFNEVLTTYEKISLKLNKNIINFWFCPKFYFSPNISFGHKQCNFHSRVVQVPLISRKKLNNFPQKVFAIVFPRKKKTFSGRLKYWSFVNHAKNLSIKMQEISLETMKENIKYWVSRETFQKVPLSTYEAVLTSLPTHFGQSQKKTVLSFILFQI